MAASTDTAQADGTLQRLLRRLRDRHGAQSATAFMLSLAAAATEGVGILVLIPILSLLGLSATDASLPMSDVSGAGLIGDDITIVIGIFLVVLVIRQSIVYLQRVRIARLRLDFIKQLRVDLFSALSNARWEQFSASALHRQVQILALGSQRAGEAAQHCFTLAAALLVALVQMALAIWLSPLISIVAVASMAGVIVVFRKRVRKTESLGRRLTDQNDAFFELTANFLPMLRSGKMSGSTDQLIDRFDQQIDRINETVERFVAQHTASAVGLQLAAGIILSLCLLVSVRLIALDGLQITLLVLIFARITPVIGQVYQTVHRLAHELPAVDNALSGIDSWQLLAESSAAPLPEIPTPVNSIGMRGVSVGYSAGGPDHVLHDVSFTMPAGTVTLLDGPTGSGKTTVADLLAGLLYPESGAIMLDDHPVTAAEVPAWRRRVGYVDQDATLMSGTIEDNLLWGLDPVDDARKTDALRAAGVSDFLQQLPDGLLSQVGDRGAQLSGGQRQRIAIARELIRLPALLILDEASSGLDEATEARLFRNLQGMQHNMTILLISHRRSARDYAATIVSLDDGRIVAVDARGQPTSDSAGASDLLPGVPG